MSCGNLIRMAIAVLFVTVWSGRAAATDPFQLSWGKQWGGSLNDYPANGFGRESQGDLIIAGVKDNPGNSTTSTTFFMERRDSQGNLINSTTETKAWWEYPQAFNIDILGNRYVFGAATGPSGGAYYGSRDAFMRKYDSTGTLLWQRQVGTSAYEHGFNGATDAQGNTYFCLSTNGSVAGPATYGMDAVVVKYDRDGNQQWVRQYNLSTWDNPGHCRVDSQGNLYVIDTHNDNSVRLMKLNDAGDIQWATVLASAGQGGGTRPAGFDSFGRFVFLMETSVALAGVAKGGVDLALGRCDSSGNLSWIGQYGGSGNDGFYAATIDAADNVAFAGMTEGSWLGTNQGGVDATVGLIDSAGLLTYGSQIGGTGNDYFNGIELSANGYVVAGQTNGSILNWGTNSGGYDILLGEVAIPEPSSLLFLAFGGLLLLRQRRS